jgi:DNA modification methylase
MRELLAAAGRVYTEQKNLCIWNKTNAGMGSLYRSKHELVFVFKLGTEAHVNNIELGRHGRYRTNVWDYAGATAGPSGPERADLALHPTVKPVAMIADAIRDCSRRGDIVLDPCGGSGSTLVAAERTKRRGRLIELDPIYVDVTIRRWQERTGGIAFLQDGRSFSAVADSRRQNPPQKSEDGK